MSLMVDLRGKLHPLLRGLVEAMPEDELAARIARSRAIADDWCRARDWSVDKAIGAGGTAPVFLVNSPTGEFALKLLDEEFSEGARGEETGKRIQLQLALRNHDCKNLVQVFEGGIFAGRHFLLMSRAPGCELTDILPSLPRSAIRSILDQVVDACIYLRGRGLCHRDIKIANIFYSVERDLATVLDLSVMRGIHDPLGVGTDNGGQLPVVATTRYTPPEYLFRLIEPGPDLWHAVDVYQLGALLHDLIMRRQLFADEYESSKENRYRFAWLASTIVPKVEASDVDADLVFLARRALDKNWKRRSQIELIDFKDAGEARRRSAERALGIGIQKATKVNQETENLRRNIRELGREVEVAVAEILVEKGIRATRQFIASAKDSEFEVEFRWQLPEGIQGDVLESPVFIVKLTAFLEGAIDQARVHVAAHVMLRVSVSGRAAEAAMELPPIPMMAGAAPEIASSVYEAMLKLSWKLLSS